MVRVGRICSAGPLHRAGRHSSGEWLQSLLLHASQCAAGTSCMLEGEETYGFQEVRAHGTPVHGMHMHGMLPAG